MMNSSVQTNYDLVRGCGDVCIMYVRLPNFIAINGFCFAHLPSAYTNLRCLFLLSKCILKDDFRV